VAKLLVSSKTPFIPVSRLWEGIETSYVTGDDHLGARQAVEHLIALGYKRIGFIGGPAAVQSTTIACRRTGRSFKSTVLSLRKNGSVTRTFTQAAGWEVGRRTLSLTVWLTAIFAANDVTSLGVLQAAEAPGLSVPKDLSLVGYDDISYASLPRIQLTTIT